MMLRPPLMLPAEVLTLQQAAWHARCSADVIRRWNRKFVIASQSSSSAPLRVSGPALYMVMNGDLDTLELLRKGQRDHSDVRRYLAHWSIVVATATA